MTAGGPASTHRRSYGGSNTALHSSPDPSGVRLQHSDDATLTAAGADAAMGASLAQLPGGGVHASPAVSPGDCGAAAGAAGDHSGVGGWEGGGGGGSPSNSAGSVLALPGAAATTRFDGNHCNGGRTDGRPQVIISEPAWARCTFGCHCSNKPLQFPIPHHPLSSVLPPEFMLRHPSDFSDAGLESADDGKRHQVRSLILTATHPNSAEHSRRPSPSAAVTAAAGEAAVGGPTTPRTAPRLTPQW